MKTGEYLKLSQRDCTTILFLLDQLNKVDVLTSAPPSLCIQDVYVADWEGELSLGNEPKLLQEIIYILTRRVYNAERDPVGAMSIVLGEHISYYNLGATVEEVYYDRHVGTVILFIDWIELIVCESLTKPIKKKEQKPTLQVRRKRKMLF